MPYSPPNPTAQPSLIHKHTDEFPTFEECTGRIYGRNDGGILERTLGEGGYWRRETPDVLVGKDGKEYGPMTNKLGNHTEPRPPVWGGTGKPHWRIETARCEFDSVVEHAREIMGRSRGCNEWGGRTTLSSFMARQFDVDHAAVSASATLMEMLDREIDLSTVTSKIEAAPVGGSPRVGAFLAGSPMSMNRVVSPVSTDGPVQIYVSTASSAGVGEEKLRERGIAALALARMVQMVRPVELWTTSNITSFGMPGHQDRAERRVRSCNNMLAMRISTAPFDVNSGATALCDPFVARGLGYQIPRLMAGHSVNAGAGFGWSPIPDAVMLQADDKRDILIGSNHLMMRIGVEISALNWVKKELGAWLDRNGQSAAAQSILSTYHKKGYTPDGRRTKEKKYA